MAIVTYFLAGSVILGIIAVMVAFSLRAEILPNTRWFRFMSFATLLLATGFVVHTLGDFLAPPYGYSAELALESIAHVIILVGFILFLLAARQVLDISKEHGFK